MDSLKIIVSAILDAKTTEKDINQKLIDLESKIKKLNISFNIDDSVVNTLASLNNQINSSVKSLNSQKNALSDSTREIKHATKNIDEQSKATEKAANAERKWRLEKEKRITSGGEVTKINTHGNGIAKQTVTLTHDDAIVKIVDEVDYNKQLKEKQRILKEAETIDRAHYNALKENKQKIEALEKLHYLALEQNRKLDLQAQQRAQKEAEALDRAHFAALKDNKKRIEDMEKLHHVALLQNQKRDEDFLYRKQVLETKIADIRRRFGSQQSVSLALDGVSSNLNSITTSTGNYSRALKEVDLQLKRITASANTAKSNMVSFGESMKTALVKFSIWIASATLIYFPIRQFQQGLDYIHQIDTAMVDLRKVTNETASAYVQFEKDANKMASTLAATTIDVITSTTEWARLGYNLKEASILAEKAIIFSNVGRMGIEEANRNMISIIKGFGIAIDEEGKNIGRALDMINEVDNNFAINSEGISEGLRRSASSLSAAGNSLEESIALITAANTVVQNPERVGNGLKTVTMRLRGISEEGEDLSNLVPKLEEKFNSLGLTIKKDQNTFKNTYEVFKDLATVWDKLTDFQQAEIIELVAGKHQGNVIQSLVSNFSEAEGALNAALNSSGSAMKEYENYLTSIDAKLATFKNTVIGFWQTAINSDAAKSFIDLGTAIVQALQNIVEQFGLMPTIVSAATTALLLFNKTLRASALTTFGIDLKAVALATKIFTGSTIAARAAVIGLQAALTMGLSLAIAGIVAGFTHLISKSQEQKKIQEQLTSRNKKIIQSWTDQKDRVLELVDTYNALNNLTKDGTVFGSLEQEQEYRNVVESISELMPNLISHIDEKGNKHLKNAEAIERELERTRQLQKEQINLDINTAKDEYSEKIQEIQDYYDAIEDIKKKRFDVEEIKIAFASGTDAEKQAELLKKWNVELSELDLQLLDNSELIRKWEIKLNELDIQLLNTQEQLANTSDALRGLAGDIVRKTLQSFDVQINPETSKEIKNIIDSLDSDVLNDASKLDQFTKSLATLISILSDGIVNEKETERFNQITKALDLSDETISRLKASLKEAAVAGNEFKNSINVTEILSNITKLVGDTTKEISSLSSAYQTLQKGEKLSLESISELIKKYPTLAQYINQTNDLTFNKGELLKQVAKVQQDNAIKELEIQKNSVENTRKELEAKRKMFEQFFNATSLVMPLGGFLNAGVQGLFAAQDKTLNDQLESINAQKKILSAPIEYTFDAKTPKAKSSAGTKEKSPYTANLKVDKFQEAVNKANRALEENNIQIEEAIAQGKNYDSLLTNRIKLYGDLSKALNDLQKNQVNRKNELSSKLLSWGLIDKNGDAYADANKRLEEMSKKEFSTVGSGKNKKQKLTFGYSIKDIEKFLEEYLGLTDKIADTSNKLEKNIIDIGDTLTKNLDRIKNYGDKHRDGLNYKISMLGEIDTEEEKQLLAKYSDGIVRSLISTRKKINDEIYKANQIINSSKTTEEQKRAYKVYLETLTQSMQEINVEIVNQSEALGIKQGEALVHGFNKSIEDLEFKLSLLGSIDTEEEKRKAKEINDQISKVLIDKAEAVNKRLLQLREELNRDLSFSDRHRVLSEINFYEQEQRNIAQYLIKIADEQKKVRMDIVNTIKKAYEQLRDAEKKRHEERIKELDEEAKKYKEVVDEIIKQIDREAAAEDYEESLKKKQQEAQEIQSKINELALDDSEKAKAKKEELEKQLADKLDEIQKMQREHSRDMRKQSLQDLAEAKQKEIEREKEALNNQQQEREKYWENLLNDDEKFLQMQTDLVNGNTEEIGRLIEQLQLDINSNMDVIGESISRNLINKLREAQDALNSIGVDIPSIPGSYSPPPNSPYDPNNSNPSGGGRYTPVGNGKYAPSSQPEMDIISQMYENSKKWRNASSQKERDEIHSRNVRLGSQIGANYNSRVGTWYKNGLQLYHEGGIVGGSGSPLLEKLHKVLNLGADERLSVLRLGELVVRDKPAINLNSIKQPNVSVPGNNSSLYLSFERLIQIDKVEKDVDLDNAMNQVLNKFERRMKQLGFVMGNRL
ncbi:phage tail tape measure protein [Paenibacillus dendritiformis]|uniref:phage tail tape measure protein n=1 Tax=Paenibacillus dendritiformis TaxID=130049 RepID=UPI00387E1679